MSWPSTKPSWLWLPWWVSCAIAGCGWVAVARGATAWGLWSIFLVACGYALVALWPRGMAPFGPGIVAWLGAQAVLGGGSFLLTLGRGSVDWSWFALVAFVVLGCLLVVILTALLVLLVVMPIYIAANRFGVSSGSAWNSEVEAPLPLRQRLLVAAIFPLVLAIALSVQGAVRADPALDLPTMMEVRLQMLAVLGVMRPGVELLSLPLLWVTRVFTLAVVGCLLGLAGSGPRRSGGSGGSDGSEEWTWALWGRPLGRTFDRS